MWDVGRTQEEFVNHEPQSSDLQILFHELQHPLIVVYQPINPRNLWSTTFM